jgi:hypothetical protein
MYEERNIKKALASIKKLDNKNAIVVLDEYILETSLKCRFRGSGCLSYAIDCHELTTRMCGIYDPFNESCQKFLILLAQLSYVYDSLVNKQNDIPDCLLTLYKYIVCLSEIMQFQKRGDNNPRSIPKDMVFTRSNRHG